MSDDDRTAIRLQARLVDKDKLPADLEPVVRAGAAASDQELHVAHPGVGGRSYAHDNDEHREGGR